MEDTEQDPYDLPLAPIVAEIDSLDWSDVECTPLGEPPLNDFYRTVPKPQQAKYYRYFREMLNREQISARSFLLTTYVLKIRSSNYYALMLRKRYFEKQAFQEEAFGRQIRFVNCLLSRNGKEYQLWTYKKKLFLQFAANISAPEPYYLRERQFLEYLLEIDSKNYHVWDYRLWLTVHFKHEQEQLLRTATLLYQDTQSELIKQLEAQQFAVHRVDWSNCYSLWSYRHNLFSLHLKGTEGEQAREMERGEVERVKKWVVEKGNLMNECGWNYLSGIVLEYGIKSRELVQQIFQLADSVFRLNKANRFAGGVCIILGEELGDDQKVRCRRKQILVDLAKEDRVRELYYQHLLSASD